MTQSVKAKNHRGKNPNTETELCRAAKAPVDKCSWYNHRSPQQRAAGASGLPQDKLDAIRATTTRTREERALGAKLDQLLGRASWVPPFSDRDYWGTR